MTGIWFTADTHFGHGSMVTKGWRPQYSTVEAMDADLIERWNDTVRPQDTVWHLGDFAMSERSLPIAAKLHGTIHLIAGNHDAVWSGHREAHKRQPVWLAAGFASVQMLARRRVDGRDVLMTHLPYEGDHVELERYSEYRLRDCGLPLLHGHVHGAWHTRGRQINVGVDVRGFRPVGLGEITAEVQALAVEPAA